MFMFPFSSLQFSAPSLAHSGTQLERVGKADRFPIFEEALEAYNSSEYKAAVAALVDGAVRDFRIVEGVN